MLLFQDIIDFYPSKRIKKKLSSKKEIIIYATTPWWINFCLILAKFILERSEKVIFVYSNFSTADNYNPDNDKIFYYDLKKKLKDLNDRLEIKFLDYNKDSYVSHKSITLRKNIEIDYKYYNKENNIEKYDNKLFSKYKKNREKLINFLKERINKNKKYQIITHGGVYGESDELRYHFKNIDITYIESMPRNSIFYKNFMINRNLSPLFFSYKSITKSYENFKKINFEKGLINKFVEDDIKRLTNPSGNINRYQNYKKSDEKLFKDIKKFLGKKKSKKIIIILGYTFELIARERSSIFINQDLWLNELLDFLIKIDEIKVVIRLHPIAGLSNVDFKNDYLDIGKSQDQTINILKKIKTNNNFKIITNNDQLNFYEIINLFDLNLNFASTTGIESQIINKNIDVLYPGVDYHFAHMKTVENPKTKKEYFKKLKDILNAKNNKRSDSLHQYIKNYYFFWFYYNTYDLPFTIHTARYNFEFNVSKNIDSLENFLNGSWYTFNIILDKDFKLSYKVIKDHLIKIFLSNLSDYKCNIGSIKKIPDFKLYPYKNLIRQHLKKEQEKLKNFFKYNGDFESIINLNRLLNEKWPIFYETLN